MTTTTNKINLSKETLSILKNFASLNSNILVKPGNVLRTITPSKNGMAEAKVSESFDTEFGIWDLNKFLGVISLFNNPNFEFHDKYVIISGGGSQKVKYYYSEPKLLTTPTKNVNMPDSVVSATLSGADFTQIQKASAVMQLPDLSFVNKNGSIVAAVTDLKDPTSNNYEVEVGDYDGNADFKFNFQIQNIKLLAGDYDINFAKNTVAEFRNVNTDLVYWFAMESGSTYTE
jgi:hypothetical protein